MPTWDLRPALFGGLAIAFAACSDSTDPGIARENPASSRAEATRNGRIVFVSDRSGDFEIYTMNPDGPGRRTAA